MKENAKSQIIVIKFFDTNEIGICKPTFYTKVVVNNFEKKIKFLSTNTYVFTYFCQLVQRIGQAFAPIAVINTHLRYLINNLYFSHAMIAMPNYRLGPVLLMVYSFALTAQLCTAVLEYT